MNTALFWILAVSFGMPVFAVSSMYFDLIGGVL